MRKILLILFSLNVLSFANYSEEQAVLIAQTEVKSMASFDSTDGWTGQTVISSTKPVYIDGIEGISYYECKATTNGADAGYVLVNVNQTDLPITESSPSGKTITEMYQERLGHANFDLVRYDWSKTVAVERVQNRSGAITVTESNILENCGFVGAESGTRSADNNVAYAEIQKFQSLISLRGCNPMYTKAALDEMYEEEEQFTESQTRGGFDTEFTEEASRLQNKMVHGMHTPNWWQHQISSDPERVVGCGNTAWAILYAYFKAFLGAEYLMPGLDLTNVYEVSLNTPEAEECMEECYVYCETFHKSGEPGGGTSWEDEPKGIQYAHKQGYSLATAGRVDYASAHKNFKVIHKQLQENKPVILGCWLDKDDDDLNLDENIGHYVVIEAAFRNRHRRVLGKLKGPWINRDVKYHVNLGWFTWKKERKWLYVRDFHHNTHTVHSERCAVIVDIPTSNVEVPTPPPVKLVESLIEYKSNYVEIFWWPMWLPAIPITNYRVEVLENGVWVEKARTSKTTYRFTGEHGTSITYRICSERVSTVNSSNFAISSYYEGNIKFADYDNKEDITWHLGKDEYDLLSGWTSPNNFFEKTAHGVGLLYGNSIGSDYGATVIEKKLDSREREISKGTNTLVITKRSDPEEYFNYRHGSYILIEREGFEQISLYLNDNDIGFYVSQQNGPDITGVHSVKSLGNDTYEHAIDLTALKLDGQIITGIRIVEAYNAPDDLYAMEMNSREYCKIELKKIEKVPNVNFIRLTPSILTTGEQTSISVGANSGGSVANFQMTVLKYLAPNWSMLSNQYLPSSAQVLSNTYSSRGDYRLEITANGVDGNNQSKKIYDTKVEDPAPVVSFELPTKEIVQKQVSITPVVMANPVVTYEWSWGDGTTSTLTAPVAVSHAYAKPGKYSVTLRAIGPDRETSVSKVIDIFVDMTPVNMLLLD